MTFFDTEIDEKIDYSTDYVNSAFSQNPFYGYIFQGIGIFLAKLLDLNQIWLLWLGRIFNLLFYGTVCAISIKKAPIFKTPLLVVSCLPLAIYQGASMSIDATINAFMILSIAYFFFLYNAPNNSLKYKEVLIFFISCLLASLIKSPYLLFGFLIFLIPKEKFKKKKYYLISRVSFLIICLVCFTYSTYAVNQLNNSWRGEYYIEKNVSAKGQINYILNNPLDFIPTFLQIFSSVPIMFIGFFEFIFSFTSKNGLGIAGNLLGISYIFFFISMSLFYPLKEKIHRNDKIKVFILIVLTYVSTFMIQFLTWAKIGSHDITNGVLSRYFIPLLAILPFSLNINKIKLDKEKFDKYIITFVIIFIIGMLILILGYKY